MITEIMSSSHDQRVVALVDMDCFYCQVETRLNPDLRGKPVAVVQYNQWKGGGLIAVNYEAKGQGVTRGMRGSEAKGICPDINLVSVPVLRGKSDLSKYRDAGEEVAKIFSLFSSQIQRASIDEAYIDLTNIVNDKIKSGISKIDESQLKSTYVIGFSDLKRNNEEERKFGLNKWMKLVSERSSISPEFQLTVGALIVEEMRERILEKTGFHCSAGIAHNKTLAKLAAGLHKPKHQTILPEDGVPELYNSLPIHKMRNLGGKFGRDVIEKLSVQHMSDLCKYTLNELQQKFDEKPGLWLYNIARGIDLEPVSQRLIPDSIGCCKNFPGKMMLATRGDVEHWIGELADEISERLAKDAEKNRRRANLITVSLYQSAPISRSDCLSSYDTKSIAGAALQILKKFNTSPSSSDVWEPPIKFLGLSVSKFTKSGMSLDKFLRVKGNAGSGDATRARRGSENAEEMSGPVRDAGRTGISPNSKAPSDESGKRESGQSSFFLSFLNSRAGAEVATSDDGRSERELRTGEGGDGSKASTSSDSLRDDGAGDGPRASDGVEFHPESGGNACDTHRCDECGQNINIMDFFEHLDYHAALKLQTEMNMEVSEGSNGTVNAKRGKGSHEVHSKRKHLGNDKPISKKTKDIKSFFKVVTKSET